MGLLHDVLPMSSHASLFSFLDVAAEVILLSLSDGTMKTCCTRSPKPIGMADFLYRSLPSLPERCLAF